MEDSCITCMWHDDCYMQCSNSALCNDYIRIMPTKK